MARVAIALALLLPGAALAGRPLTTEDAAVLEDKACQLEAWVDRARASTTGWLVPSCNFGLGIEWQVGAARERERGEGRFAEAYAQAKGLWREAAGESRWSAGWIAGVARRPRNEAHRGWDHPYVLLPVSWSAGDLSFHVQPGWSRDRETGRDLAVWGAAVEHGGGPLDWIGEVFGADSEKPFVRVGVRWSPVKGHLDLDLTYLARPGGARDERLVSLGLVWSLPRLLR